MSVSEFVTIELASFGRFLDGIQRHHRHHLLPAPCPLLYAHLCLRPGRHRHPEPGVLAGLPREPVCGLVGAVPGEEALGDLLAGAESRRGGCFRAAQRPVFSALPGWRPGLGVWLGGVQAGALPVEREHVRVHLPHLPDEHGPLVGGDEAFSVPENADQAFPVGPPAGDLDLSLHPVAADAFLPQVRRHFRCAIDFLMAAVWHVSHDSNWCEVKQIKDTVHMLIRPFPLLNKAPARNPDTLVVVGLDGHHPKASVFDEALHVKQKKFGQLCSYEKAVSVYKLYL